MIQQAPGPIHLQSGWAAHFVVDEDGHLNIYLTNSDRTRIFEIETGQGDGEDGEQYALRFTTEGIEAAYEQAFETYLEEIP